MELCQNIALTQIQFMQCNVMQCNTVLCNYNQTNKPISTVMTGIDIKLNTNVASPDATFYSIL